MPAFTMQYKEVLEILYNTDDVEDWGITYAAFMYNDVIYGKLPVLPDPKLTGLGTYPIFDETYRAILNGKIVDNYWNREIGTETIDNFVMTVRRRMDLIMPYYNKLYATELIDYSALQTMEINTIRSQNVESEETTEADATSINENSSKARAVNSSTPQTMLSGNADYASSASDTNSQAEIESTSNQKGSADTKTDMASDSKTTGFQGASSDLVMRYRNSLLNIDAMILADIEELFMLVWDSGDAYTNEQYSTSGWLY